MKGFTLIEALIVTLVFSIMVAAIYGVLIIGNSTFNSSSGLLDLTQQARGAMVRLVKEVRGSSSLTINSASHITFTTPAASNVQYYLNGSNLVREYPAGTQQVLASNITGLTFSSPVGQDKLLKIQMNAGKTVFRRALSFSLIEEVRLRNE